MRTEAHGESAAIASVQPVAGREVQHRVARTAGLDDVATAVEDDGMNGDVLERIPDDLILVASRRYPDTGAVSCAPFLRGPERMGCGGVSLAAVAVSAPSPTSASARPTNDGSVNVLSRSSLESTLKCNVVGSAACRS